MVVSGRFTRFYLYLAALGLIYAQPGMLCAADMKPTEPDQPEQTATPTTPNWRKKKEKKKSTILQSWKKVVTLDWDNITPHDERNLLVSATCAAIIYSCYHMLTSRAAVPQPDRRLRNPADPEEVDNSADPALATTTAGKVKKRKPTYARANVTLSEHRVLRPTAIRQQGNSMCGIYAAHNASEVLRHISQHPDFKVNNQDELLHIMDTVLAQNPALLNTRLDINTPVNNKDHYWAGLVCENRRYEGLKKFFYTLLHKTLMQHKKITAQEKHRKKYSGFVWSFIGWLVTEAPTPQLTLEEDLALNDIANVFAKYILAGNNIALTSLTDQEAFKQIFNKASPLIFKTNDPEYRAEGERGQNNKITAAYQLLQNQAFTAMLTNTFGANISLQNCKLIGVDMTGNNLSSDETTTLLKKAKLGYSILEDMDEYDDAAKAMLIGANQARYNLNGKATAIDTTNANQAGFYQVVIREVKKQMYASRTTFTHAFLIRTGRAKDTVDNNDNIKDVTAALDATGISHWVALVVIRTQDAANQWKNYYVTVDSISQFTSIDSEEYKDIIEMLEPNPEAQPQNQQPQPQPTPPPVTQ